MEIAIQYLKNKIQECLESDMSPMAKDHMVSEFTKAIHVLEYERYNFVPRQTDADLLNQVESWKKQWNSGQYKFIPELLGLTKAIILDKAFSETEIAVTIDSQQPKVLIEKEPITEPTESEEKEIVDLENEVEEVRVEGRAVEEVRVEGRAVEEPKQRKRLLSWFKK